jgi:signal transduction histidine kinase
MKSFITKYSLLFHLLGALTGVFICLIFVALDINQLGIDYSLTNILEIFSNQYVYIFSLVFFPIVAVILSFLIINSFKHNQKLAIQKRFSDNLLDSIGKPIFICNRHLEIVYSNLCFKTQFNCGTVDELLGKNNSNIIHYIKSGSGFVNQEVTLNLGGEEESIFYINCSHFLEMEYDAETNDQRLILNMQDVTSIKKSELLLQEKDALIRTHAHLSSLGEMAAGFAHEINNPLAIISANNHILKKLITKGDVQSERFLKALDDNETTIDRITKIISSLRALARDKEGESLAHMALAPSLEEALNLCQIKINNTSVRFTAELNGIERRIVSIRKLQFAQVLVNLLNNAIDAVKEQIDPQSGRHNGWVKLLLEENDSSIIIRIIDSGSGIPYELQDKIFEPLFTTKDIGEGTGLGLSLCQKMIDEHNGTLELNNNSPNTEFVITIPKSLPNEEPEAA